MFARPAVSFALTLAAIASARSADPFEVRTLAKTRFAFTTITAPLEELSPKIDAALLDVRGKLKNAGIAPVNGALLVTTAGGPDPAEPMTMQVGYPIMPGESAAGCDVLDLESVESACVLYTGTTERLSERIGQLYEDVIRSGRQPGGAFRERVLYWESPDSQNNMMLLELPLAPK